MSKTYAAPALEAKGSVIDLTQFGNIGPGDPHNALVGLSTAPGNVGFQV